MSRGAACTGIGKRNAELWVKSERGKKSEKRRARREERRGEKVSFYT